ncbi:MAG: hypothetical protein M5U09_11955 [Gammaproteobacteria bacterium]|nr:hypothetical protein [Gammaproteobacteria bacterium]
MDLRLPGLAHAAELPVGHGRAVEVADRRLLELFQCRLAVVFLEERPDQLGLGGRQPLARFLAQPGGEFIVKGGGRTVHGESLWHWCRRGGIALARCSSAKYQCLSDFVQKYSA